VVTSPFYDDIFNHFYAWRPMEDTEFGEITQNKGHYAVRSMSLSFKVSEFGINRKLIYDFILVINTNLPVPPILHRIRDIAFDRSKIAIFGYPSCV